MTLRKTLFVIPILMCFLLASTYAGLNSFSLQFNSYGAISVFGHFTVTGVNGVYAGTENISPYRTTAGSDAVTVISTVFGWMSSGQGVELIGNFTWTRAYVLSKSITMNCTQADIIIAVAPWPFQVSARATILGGHWIGSANEAYVLFASGSSYSVVDGCDFQNFGAYFAYGSSFSHITIQNCTFHDRVRVTSGPCISGSSNGYNIIQNCRFLNNDGNAIFLDYTAMYNQILNCEFANQTYSHSIYLNGYDGGLGGSNIISGCTFHDIDGTARMSGAIQIKCPNNKLYNNTFYNYTEAVGISIYSQYVGSAANDNEVYDNTFTDMDNAIWLGHADLTYSPTLRNKIHDNTFTRVAYGVWLNPFAGTTTAVEDTWVYYNTFIDCTNPFQRSGASASLVKNTVIAYNTFDATVLSSDVAALQSYVNTLIYGNAPWLADYPTPLPSNLPLPPR